MIMMLMAHNDIKTTLRYLHTSNKDLLKTISLLDDLDLTLFVFALLPYNRGFPFKSLKKKQLKKLFAKISSVF